MSAVVAALLLFTAVAAGCSGDAPAGDTTTTSDHAIEPSTSTTAKVEEDPTLEPYLLSADDLPAGFEPSEHALDDTITSFCAGEDATAGLSASGRAARAFTRTPAGASVIQIVYRFDDDGAAAFVSAAEAILQRCSEVPDLSGLAFRYEPLSADVEAPLDDAVDATGSYGTSVGSEALTIEIAALRHGDVGQLVAVLGLDIPRDELDSIAEQAFRAVASRASVSGDGA